MMYDHDHDNEVMLFGETDYRNQPRRFGIKTDDRRRHMYVIGKTGVGKSTLLENLIIGDIRAGHGIAVVDPHGDLVEKILEYIPSNRINDVVYVNPADLDFPIGFNVFEAVEAKYKHLIASGLMAVFTKIWEGVWSARMEYILNNTVLALLDYPGSTLLGINRLLVDKPYRQKVLAKVADPVVRQFWLAEYEAYSDKFRTEAIAPIQNKVGQFLSSSIIRNIVGQSKSTINIRQIMDEGKILLLNLAKGRVGEDNSALLGAMIITRIQLAAMSRVDIAPKDRRDFYLYVDEFQNFATESFADILSEARKYHLSLIMAHQYIEQLEEEVAAGIFGNVGTIVAFRVGASDAEELEKEFTPQFTIQDLVGLAKYHMYLKLMIDGVTSNAFSAQGLPPLELSSKPTDNRDKVIKVSRERWAQPRADVEEKILRWSGMDEVFKAMAIGETDVENARFKEGVVMPSAPIMARAPFVTSNEPVKKKKKKKQTEKIFDIICSECGQKTKIGFEPDPSRPIFCDDCWTKKQKELEMAPVKVETKKIKPPKIIQKTPTPIMKPASLIIKPKITPLPKPTSSPTPLAQHPKPGEVIKLPHKE